MNSLDLNLDKIRSVLKKYTMDVMLSPIEDAIKGKSPDEIKEVVGKLVSDEDLITFKQGYSSALTLLTGKLGMNPEWMIPKGDLEVCYQLVIDTMKTIGI